MEGNTQSLEELVGNILQVPVIDKTLTKDGYGADAKVVGGRFNDFSTRMGKLSKANGITYNGTNSGLESTNVNDAIDEVYAFQKNGGRVNGRIDVGNNYDNGYGSINKNYLETVDYGTQLVDVDGSGKTASISVRALMGSIVYTDTDGKIHNIFNSKNKPFGNYDGKGGNNVVDTGGVGNFLLLYMDTQLAFVTPKGALKVALTTGEISWLDGQSINYRSGRLTINAVAPFDVIGTVYYYQVI